MTVIGMAFGAGLVATLGFALASKARWVSVGAWSTLAFGWTVTVLIAPFGDEYVWLWPIADAVFGTIAIAMAFRFRLLWPALLALLYLGQCISHIGWHFMQLYAAPDPDRLLRYYRTINLLLVAQMITVAWPGASRGVSVLVSGLRSVSRSRDQKGLARR
jgi:hypothetical protein